MLGHVTLNLPSMTSNNLENFYAIKHGTLLIFSCPSTRDFLAVSSDPQLNSN
jgi:hypothetical protein